jgi:hypothetical protein
VLSWSGLALQPVGWTALRKPPTGRQRARCMPGAEDTDPPGLRALGMRVIVLFRTLCVFLDEVAHPLDGDPRHPSERGPTHLRWPRAPLTRIRGREPLLHRVRDSWHDS